MTIRQHRVPWRPYCQSLVEGTLDAYVPAGCYAELVGYAFYYSGTSPDDATFTSVGIDDIEFLVIQAGGEDVVNQYTVLPSVFAMADESIRVQEAGTGSGPARITLSVFAWLYPLEGLFTPTT